MSTRRQPTEPEIIPPGQEPADWRQGHPDPWAHFSVHGTHRIYVRRVGPVGILLLAALIGTLAALVFVMLVGAFVVAVPVAILLVVAAIVGGLMRRYMRQ
ncbi:MAG TPA: hypothetical protein VKX28_31440 [Xanthobacteraceae bacterium]|jgi:hypothetical protein|nr:hypothetical protein [Xanthobacteraceae bacterium]